MIVSVCVLSAAAFLATGARAAGPEVRDLTEMPIEDLMKIEVTSVSRAEASLSESAAAVTVITEDDIRRSGATSIAEALRLVPGLDVARLTSSIWAISSRGFNGRFANKMLVMIDGRTVYTPAFGGVFWGVQDTVLEDIERIEVIRGPGASIWGANAVNGVINITTKSASATKGGLVSAIVGSEDRDIETVRVGGGAADSFSWRVFGKHLARNAFGRPDGREGADDGKMWRGGFRLDAKVGDRDGLTLQGESYTGVFGQTSKVISQAPPFASVEDSRVPMKGSNLLGRWTRTYSDASDLRLQIYFDHTDWQDVVIAERRNTYDIDFQHRFPLGSRQDVVWGLSYRRTNDRVRNTFSVSILPDHRTDRLASVFVQDQVRLSEDRWHLVVGSKFENNSYTGWELEPTVRLLCRIDERQTAWAAVSRAVRIPNRVDTSTFGRVDAVPAGPGLEAFVVLNGNPDLDSESLLAYEAGYRTQLSDRLGFDVAAYYNRYQSLRSIEQGAPTFETDPPPPHLEIPITFGNEAEADSLGLEASGSWRVARRFRLRGWYSYLHLSFQPDAGSTDMSDPAGDVPRHQARLWASIDLPHDLALDVSAQFVDRLSGQGVPSYVRGDIRLAWHPGDHFQAEAGVRNLLDSRHTEFSTPNEAVESTQIERSWYAGFTWRF